MSRKCYTVVFDDTTEEWFVMDIETDDDYFTPTFPNRKDAQIHADLLNMKGNGFSDPVNHPSHYETGRFECIEVMLETQGVEATKNFCFCNAFKYLYRHRNKNGVEDIKKARWYLDKYIELEGQK